MRSTPDSRKSRSSDARLNYANAGLMVLSCLGAYLYPFELFLLAYAVLGPLHYLTEISWLHDRDYFTEDKKARQRWLVLVTGAMAVLIAGLIAERTGRALNPKWEIGLVYLVFATALVVAVVRSANARTLLVVAATVSVAVFSNSQAYFVIAYFLITIIHVFVFTGAFVLYGALKTRSTSGLLSISVFLICAVGFFVYIPESTYAAGEYARSAYSAFQALNLQLLKLLHPGAGTSRTVIYESGAGLSVMRLIAFAYTYHYLNWFSKTSIIGWHQIPRRRVLGIVALWLLSISIYAYNYLTGMTVLYFLSILHVMLEFPLNHQTFVGIGRLLYRRRVTRGKFALDTTSLEP